MKLLRLEHLNLALVIGAFTGSLFFNGIDIRFFSLSFLLLLGWQFSTGIGVYTQGYRPGNMLLPISVLLFWLWLAITIPFSQIFYLSVVNFWWVGIFPLTFLLFTFTADKEPLWHRVFVSLVFVVAILCLYALYQMYGLHEQPRATFYNKNSLAALINLLLLPLIALVVTTDRKQTLYSALVILFMFSMLLVLVNSRGALIGTVIGLVMLMLLALQQIDKKRLLLSGIVLVMAFVSAQLLFEYGPRLTDSGTVERLLTLQDTQSAGHSRFVIWQPAWDLFLQHRWVGIGLGTYFQVIPPTLHPNDHSAGFYVHNDYLQLALETGIPGLLLLVLILLATLYRLFTVMRTPAAQHSHWLEFVSLFAALLALAIHSAVTYNLYVMPVMFIAGLLLARFNQLADRLVAKPGNIHQPARLFRPGLYYLLLVLVTITPASYFLGIGVAHHYQHKAYQLMARNQLEAAHRAFHIAQTLAPRVDSAYYADADLLRKSALVLADRPELSQGLLAEAQMLLDRAELLNPLRPQTPYIRGLVLEQVSPDARVEILQVYHAALKRNPRFLPARLALARNLIAHDQPAQAQQILWQGLGYSYRQLSPAYLELLELSTAMAAQMGRHEMAARLSQILAKSRQDYAAMISASRRNSIFHPY